MYFYKLKIERVETRWLIAKDVDKQVVKDLSDVLGIDNNLATLLVQRGITSFEKAKNFFRPSLSHLHDPFLMKDMDKAVSRIKKAIDNNEKILIYGDYDVDGTTAVALIYTYLKNFCNKKKIAFYIPDRYEEGYGISYKGIDYAADNGFQLVIVLDCGIKAVERIEYANSRNVDFIICDHHRPGDKIPDAVAVLDSKRIDCQYPYKELSGCGVGFKLVTALAKSMGRPIEETYELLDLVAISIAADIVPITGENRVLAYYGLRLLNSNPRPGIEAVLHIEHGRVVRAAGIFIFGMHADFDGLKTEDNRAEFSVPAYDISHRIFARQRDSVFARTDVGPLTVDFLLESRKLINLHCRRRNLQPEGGTSPVLIQSVNCLTAVFTGQRKGRLTADRRHLIGGQTRFKQVAFRRRSKHLNCGFIINIQRFLRCRSGMVVQHIHNAVVLESEFEAVG